MQNDFYFVKEKSNRYKIKVFLTIVISLIIILGSLIAFAGTFNKIVFKLPGLSSAKEFIFTEMNSFSEISLFYSGFIGGLFFIPIPQELFFYYGLVKGNSILISLLTVNAGFLLAQAVNYLIGSKLSNFFMNIISKRKMYKARRFINKRGGFGVFIFNFLPLPAPLLTFALGITRYNKYRLIFYTLLGTGLKYGAIIVFFILVN